MYYEVHEHDERKYTPFIVVFDENRKQFATINWTAGYHSPEEDAKFRAEAFAKANAIIEALAACERLVHEQSHLIPYAIANARSARGLPPKALA